MFVPLRTGETSSVEPNAFVRKNRFESTVNRNPMATRVLRKRQ